jgi:hypothetical protein
MNKEQILDAIKGLASCQGFYGRLYAILTDGSEASNRALEVLEEQGFGDELDLILFLES